MKEIWKDVEGFDGKYSISNYGNLRRNYRNTYNKKTNQVERATSNVPIKTHTDKNGYIRCDLFHPTDNKRWSTTIHRLVALHFIPNPNNYKEIHHKDANKANNMWTNLEWCSRIYNVRHAFNNGLMNNPEGKEHFKSKAVCQIDPNTNEIIQIWDSVNMATRALGGKRSYGGSHIWDVIKGKRHTCFGYKWKLFDK